MAARKKFYSWYAASLIRPIVIRVCTQSTKGLQNVNKIIKSPSCYLPAHMYISMRIRACARPPYRYLRLPKHTPHNHSTPFLCACMFVLACPGLWPWMDSRLAFVQVPRWQSARYLFDLQNIFPFHYVSSFVTAFFIILDMCFPSLIPFPFALFNFRLLRLICLVGLLCCLSVDKTLHHEVVVAELLCYLFYIPLFPTVLRIYSWNLYASLVWYW